MTLCTKAQTEALGATGITDEAFAALEGLARPLIDSALGRPAEGGTELTETRVFDHRWPGDQIVLSRWPVASVASVTEDGSGLTVDETFRVDLAAGIITRTYDAAGNRYPFAVSVPIVVTYTPATVPVASTICAQAIARAWRTTNPTESGAKPAVMAGLRQLTIGRWSATAETSAQSAAETLHLTDNELALLRAERSRRP